MIRHGKIGPRENVLFGGATGKVMQIALEHGVTMATIQLDKRASSGSRLALRKPISELYFLDAGEWRMPRPRPSHIEHESIYATIWG